MTFSIPISTTEAFVLVATRILAVLATSPVMSLKQVPIPARLGLGLVTAFIMVPVIGIPQDIDVSWTALAGEAIVGALAGFAATVAYSSIQFGASLLDMQAGFSMASAYDPTFGAQGATIERMFSALAALLFFQTDAHHLVIQSLGELFKVVPLGSFTLDQIRPDLLATIAAASMAVAIELVFPVMVALLLADMALGVLARVAPQFGIFSIGMQLKVILALGALAVTAPLLMPRLHQVFSGVVSVSLVVVK